MDDVSLEPIILMYPYGNAAGDSIISFDISGKKCFRISIPNGGMAIFGKRHRKLYVSLLASLTTHSPPYFFTITAEGLARSLAHFHCQ